MSRDKVLRITEEEQKAIRKSYDRTDKEIEEEIQHLRDWLKKQPHLPQDEDDTRLRMMLHYNKFSLEKTKTKLNLYYSVKHLVPEFYTNREPLHPQMSELMENIILMPLPSLTSDLHRVYMFKFRDDDPSKFNMSLYLKMIFATFDLRLVHDASLGDTFLLDMQNARLGHMVQFTPISIRKSYTLLQKAYSDKIKGVHFINMPAVANTLVVLLNTILSEKLANRVHVHKDIESLKDAITPKVLPNEYGGSAGPLEDLYDNWKKYYTSQNDWLKELANKKSDETKRVGEPIDSEMFGMCGSFRKLNLD